MLSHFSCYTAQNTMYSSVHTIATALVVFSTSLWSNIVLWVLHIHGDEIVFVKCMVNSIRQHLVLE
uniref:Uncharacterized protein n=1 Tax=Anguilla anguilla TaxID=7936 RepID=A0A0E9WSP0_ANGAN